ncbi:MAG TPA: ATP-binding protein [Acidimicrobiales bacterium]|nr:ATP-binding protein [Acidimicrobiales bacterium]
MRPSGFPPFPQPPQGVPSPRPSLPKPLLLSCLISTETFLLEALGAAVVEAGMRVAWFTLESLGALVRRHRVDDTVTKVVARIVRCELIVVDDIGLLPVSADAAEGLFRLVDAAYERRSVAISSNLHPAGFDELMPKTLATATVDRLLHHAHLCMTGGDSVRLAQATAGVGVVPLTGAVAAPPRPAARRRVLPAEAVLTSTEVPGMNE